MVRDEKDSMDNEKQIDFSEEELIKQAIEEEIEIPQLTDIPNCTLIEKDGLTYITTEQAKMIFKKVNDKLVPTGIWKIEEQNIEFSENGKFKKLR